MTNELQKNQLKIVFEDFEHPTKPINIIHREDKCPSAKVGSFIDLLAKKLQANPVLN